MGSKHEISADPHVRARNLQHLLYRDDGVAIPVLGYPHRLSRSPATAAWRRPGGAIVEGWTMSARASAAALH